MKPASTEFTTDTHEVQCHLYTCEQSFQALRAVAHLIERAEKQPDGPDPEDSGDRYNLAMLLQVIADHGFSAVEEGMEATCRLNAA